MKQFDRIQLNAAIQQLIESKGFLTEARQAVYDFGILLPIQSRVSGSVQMESPGDSLTGYTQEHGNVQIDDEKDQVKKIEFGAERARIGSYKLWREKTRTGQFRITIAHFWKLDEGTDSLEEKPQVWCLACVKMVPSGLGSGPPKRFGIILAFAFSARSLWKAGALAWESITTPVGYSH